MYLVSWISGTNTTDIEGGATIHWQTAWKWMSYMCNNMICHRGFYFWRLPTTEILTTEMSHTSNISYRKKVSTLIWEKAKSYLRKHMGEKQLRFYWSCSSMEMKNATPLNITTYNCWCRRTRKIKQHNTWSCRWCPSARSECMLARCKAG